MSTPQKVRQSVSVNTHFRKVFHIHTPHTYKLDLVKILHRDCK